MATSHALAIRVDWFLDRHFCEGGRRSSVDWTKKEYQQFGYARFANGSRVFEREKIVVGTRVNEMR